MNLIQMSVDKSAKYVAARPTDLDSAVVINMIVVKRQVPYVTIAGDNGAIRHRLATVEEAAAGVNIAKFDTVMFVLKRDNGDIMNVFTRQDRIQNMPPSGIVRGCKVHVNLALAIGKDKEPILDKDGNACVNHEITFSMENAEFRKVYLNN